MNQPNFVNKAIFCPNCKKNQHILYLNSNKYNLYFCTICQNGFINPIPSEIARYYPPQYWQFPGQFANLREKLHKLLQIKRKKLIKKYLFQGEILDVGAGEGAFGKVLDNNFIVTNIDAPFAEVKNKEVIKTDFLTWNTKKKFDGIMFFESLEHVPYPQEYLKKASSLLKKDGFIFIECPRFDSWESKIFKKHWLHLDIPRHLFHFTNKGITILAERAELKTIKQYSISSFPDSPVFFLISLFNILGIKSLNLQQASLNNLLIITMIVLLLPITFLIESTFFIFNKSPIGLTILKKK